MMCTAYFGILSDKRKDQWENSDHNPYEVLAFPISLDSKAHDLLFEGSHYFRDKIKIDWGSFAWKCTIEELQRFLSDHKTTLPWLIESDEELLLQVTSYAKEHENEELGVVFVEEY